jgi:hypothetical protein
LPSQFKSPTANSISSNEQMLKKKHDLGCKEWLKTKQKDEKHLLEK